jgi:O-antigen ligase
MFRLAAYLGLLGVGLVAALISPLAGAIACLEAYLLNPVVLLGETPFRFQLWTTFAFFVGYALHRPQGLPRAGRESIPVILLWIFVMIGGASSLWAVHSSSQALNQIYELFKTILMLTFFIRVVRNESDMSALVTACILGVWHAAILHTFGVRFGYVPNAFGKEYGVLPDTQTPVMILFTPLLIVLAVLGSKVQKIISWMALPFVLNSIVSSYMRTGFVSLAMEMGLLVLFLPKRITLRLLPAVAAGALLFIFRLAPADYWERMNTIKAPTEESSANSRFVIAQASLRMLRDYPFGVGYRNYPDVSPRYLQSDFLTGGRRSAHNSFFSVLCETGIIGFGVWISAFLWAILTFRRIRKTSDSKYPSPTATYAMAFEIGLYGWMAGGMFQADHEVDPAYWFVAFSVVLARLHYQDCWQKEEELEEEDGAIASSSLA